jgi:hypothetical protein
MMKKRLLFLLLLLILPATAHAQNDTPPLLEAGVEASGSLDADSFLQNFIFLASSGDAITLDALTDSDGLSLILILTAPSGRIVAQDADLSSPAEALIADVSLPESGQYVVTVLRGEGASGDTSGDFSLNLSGELTPPSTAEGDSSTATAPVASVPGADGSTVTLAEGGIDINLTWNAAVNLDLEVRDPQGGIIFSNNLAANGGSLNADINANCGAATAEAPTETVTWPVGPVATGSYEIILYYTDACTAGGPQQFTLSANVNAQEEGSINGTLNPTQRYLAALEIDPSGEWRLYNGGVNAGLDISLLQNQITAAQDLPGTQATGAISREVPALAYRFEGVQGDTITVNMDGSSGSLDPYLILLNPDGSELSRNDDRELGNTNSTITQVLPASGVYTIVATRYGQSIGGTEGNFNLNLSLTLAGAISSSPTVSTTPVAPTGNDTVATGTDTTATAGTDTTAITTSSTRPANLPAGSVEVILTWNSTADLQLLVRDPAGASIFDDTPNAPSGGILASAGNVGCTATATNTPVSYVYWPTSRLPRGLYEVEVWYQNTCNDPTPVTFNLVVNVQGVEVINTNQPTTEGSRFAITFEVDQEGAATGYDGGFFDMTDVSSVNFFNLLSTAEVIEYGETINAQITTTERLKIYSFEATTGDRVTINMQRTGGTLDTAVYLISPQGIQLAGNDDIVDPITGARDTDSLIDTFDIQATGTYYIIATHYGLLFGGTTGTYSLTLFELP